MACCMYSELYFNQVMGEEGLTLSNKNVLLEKGRSCCVHFSVEVIKLSAQTVSSNFKRNMYQLERWTSTSVDVQANTQVDIRLLS